MDGHALMNQTCSHRLKCRSNTVAQNASSIVGYASTSECGASSSTKCLYSSFPTPVCAANRLACKNSNGRQLRNQRHQARVERRTGDRSYARRGKYVGLLERPRRRSGQSASTGAAGDGRFTDQSSRVLRIPLQGRITKYERNRDQGLGRTIRGYGRLCAFQLDPCGQLLRYQGPARSYVQESRRRDSRENTRGDPHSLQHQKRLHARGGRGGQKGVRLVRRALSALFILDEI
mmetsp:Transcript_23334/g.45440  ORF Transcript_23334/g.45440 Transcript_23334/m.45440 type:complete len:233 (+) Transcript_23334:606-1304(+)